MKIVAAYIRVSTHEQEEYSPESQIQLIRDYAKRNNMVLPPEYIFRDNGISGRSAEKRPEFLRMIGITKQKPCPFESILVWKFSRFARNQEESIVYKSLLKKESHIDVISISEPLAEGPFGGLIERIIEWFDEYYSVRLAGEVRRGMAERAGRGLPVSAAPLGYTYQDKQLVIVPEAASIVRMIYSDFLNGAPIIALAKKLNDMGIKTKRGNAWENRTIRYILTNPAYIGKIRWCTEGANNYHIDQQREGTLLVDGEHPCIIDDDTFHRAQERIASIALKHKRNGKGIRREQISYMLQGIVQCSACGSTLTFTGTGMNCSGYIHGKCKTSHFIGVEKLESLVICGIAMQMENLAFELVQRECLPKSEDATFLSLRLKKEEEILRRYKQAYAAGVDTLEEYQQNKKEAEARIQTLKETVSQQEQPKITKQEFADRHRSTVADLSNPSVTPAEKNSLLRSFVDKLIFRKSTKDIEISYYI